MERILQQNATKIDSGAKVKDVACVHQQGGEYQCQATVVASTGEKFTAAYDVTCDQQRCLLRRTAIE